MKVTESGFIEGSAPETPPTGIVKIYAKTDGLLYSKDDAGVETGLSGGGGGVVSVASADANITVVDGTSNAVLTLVQAPALKSATTTVNVSSATAPVNGQVLTATSSTAATWQTPSGSSGGVVFRASTSSAQTVPAVTGVTVELDTVEFDTNSFFNTTTYQFEPTIAGYYWIGATAGWVNEVETEARLNGMLGSLTGFVSTSSPVKKVQTSVVAYFDGVSDVARFQVGNLSASSEDLAANGCEMYGYLIKAD
jgi:hypothetical protein